MKEEDSPAEWAAPSASSVSAFASCERIYPAALLPSFTSITTRHLSLWTKEQRLSRNPSVLPCQAGHPVSLTGQLPISQAFERAVSYGGTIQLLGVARHPNGSPRTISCQFGSSREPRLIQPSKPSRWSAWDSSPLSADFSPITTVSSATRPMPLLIRARTCYSSVRRGQPTKDPGILRRGWGSWSTERLTLKGEGPRKLEPHLAPRFRLFCFLSLPTLPRHCGKLTGSLVALLNSAGLSSKS